MSPATGDTLLSRICCHCHEGKPIDLIHWYYHNGKPSGPCKECRKAKAREVYHANIPLAKAHASAYRSANVESLREKDRDRRNANREARNAKQRADYAANREQRAEAERIRRHKDPEHAREIDRKSKSRPERNLMRRKKSAEQRPELAAQARAYRENNPERCKSYDAKRYSQIKFRLTRSVSSSVRKHLVLAGSEKTGLRRLITGWSISELIAHLQLLFEPGMSINNWGLWQIDHIIPISKVSFETQSDPAFRAVWSLNNLSPLWAFDNNQKHARLDWVLPDSYSNPILREMYARPSCAYLVKP